jgi:hypothetical protein
MRRRRCRKMPYDEMDILTRGEKAVEGFYPRPYDLVDERLREASRCAGEAYREGLKQRIAEDEKYDAA